MYVAWIGNGNADQPAKKLRDISFSVLDLASIVEGGTVSAAFKNTVDLAQHVEKWNYNRFWVAEHPR